MLFYALSSGDSFVLTRQIRSEYNIIFPTIEKTVEQIISIAMASERDFDNVSCVWTCNVYAL